MTMKKDFLLSEFSNFKLLNKEFEAIRGGRRTLTSAKVIGLYTNPAGQTFMDIGYYGGDGSLVQERCDQPDADWGGVKPIGTEVG